MSKYQPSTGCGVPLPAEQVPTIPGSRTGYTDFTVDVTGATLGAPYPEFAGQRQFFVRVPADYDPNHPYRVVYIGQGCGGRRAGDTSTYPLFDEARGGGEQAVYVALSIPDNDANPGCYDNNRGASSQEWEAFDVIHSFVESHYCVDNDRIYIGGYSTGSWLATMWGCYFAGTPSPPLDQPDLLSGRSERRFAPRWAVRGTAGVAGGLSPDQPLPCNGPAAHFWMRDTLDASAPIATLPDTVNLSLESNGCIGNYADGPKQPWAPAEDIPELAGGICQEYTGCPAETAKRYPLVVCTTTGKTHSDQSFTAIPAFKKFFDLMDPAL